MPAIHFPPGEMPVPEWLTVSRYTFSILEMIDRKERYRIESRVCYRLKPQGTPENEFPELTPTSKGMSSSLPGSLSTPFTRTEGDPRNRVDSAVFSFVTSINHRRGP